MTKTNLALALLAVWCGTTAAKEAMPAAAKAQAAATKTNIVTELFDGRTLNGWKIVPFGGARDIKILANGVLEIGAGEILTGLVYTNQPLRMNYEITLEARRTRGSDFFCGLTFPVGTNSCTLILGGWGGSLTGVSSIDGMDASENQTGDSYKFEQNRWYKICLRVTSEKIQAWIDADRIVNFDIEERRLGMRPGEIEACVPLGLATYQTCGQLRNIHRRKFSDPQTP